MTTKKCSQCKEVKAISLFPKDRREKSQHRAYCKSCASKMHKSWASRNTEHLREYQRRYREKNRKRIRAWFRTWSRERYRKLRKEIINKYGGRCISCGFDDQRALHIDHVDGGGTEERRRYHNNLQGYLKKVLNDNSGKYQLLCANCNYIKKHENKEIGKMQSEKGKRG